MLRKTPERGWDYVAFGGAPSMGLGFPIALL